MTLIAWPCYSRLCEAKRRYLLEAGVRDPCQSAILKELKAITGEELVCHYRRKTRGAEVTLQLIEYLLLVLPLTLTVCLYLVNRWSPSGKKKRSISHAFKIH